MQNHRVSIVALTCGGWLGACVAEQGVDPAQADPGPAATDTSSGDHEPATETSTDDDDDGSIPTPDLPPHEEPPVDDEGCHVIYAQDLLPTFELTIHPVVWSLLQQEWHDGQMNEDLGVNPKPYHPLEEFRYGDIVIENAEIRLRGNPTAWYDNDKLQFQIGFHTNDPNGNFMGLKRLAFDAATFNRHMLRERLAYAVMRDVGIKAPCANNARLNINGEYYGIFTNVEKLDEVFLERNFDDPTGDLWKRGNWTLKTNLESSSPLRLNAMRNAADAEELFTYLDIEQALRVFAAEAVIPDSDGMWAGGLNFYIYDEPIGGKFMLLPWDKDNTFERFSHPPDGEYPANPDPFVWEKWTTHGRPCYDLALEDPMWFALYIDLIDEILHDGYTPAKMHERIETWTAQIEDAVFEDVNKPYSNALYLTKVAELHAFVETRYAFVEDWLVCWQGGGIDDGDGYCVYP